MGRYMTGVVVGPERCVMIARRQFGRQFKKLHDIDVTEEKILRSTVDGGYHSCAHEFALAGAIRPPHRLEPSIFE
jgi:hypothetical protein